MRDGHQWTHQEESELEEKSRMPAVFNRIGPELDSVSGQQINNRQVARYLPRENSDTKFAELYSEAARWADDMCDGEDEMSDAFEDMITCGMGWTETRMDYSEDPKGLLKTSERVDPIEMYWDPAAKKRNLGDANHVQRARRFDPQTAKAKWPKLEQLAINPEMVQDDDEGPQEPHDQQEAYKYENDQSGETYPRDSFYLIVQTQWWSEEPMWMVEDPDSQEVVTLENEKFEKMREFLDLYNIKYARTVKKHFWQAFSTGDTVLSSGPAPSQKGFTLRAMCAKRDRNKRSWYGLVRAMKDPQKFANKFFSDMMHIFATNRKGGFFYESGVFVDKKKALDEWASPDAAIEVIKGALTKGQIKERDAGSIPAGMDRLMQIAVQAFPEVTGRPAELLGQVDRTQSGVVEEGRKEAGLTLLAPVFGALKRHTRERGRIVLDMLENYMSDGRLIRITGKDGQQTLEQLVKPNDMATYDIIVDDVATSPNQKAMVLGVFKVLAPFLRDAQIPMPPSLLDYLPLPTTLVEEWKQMLMPKSGQGEGSNPLAEAEMVKGQTQIITKQIDAGVKMAGIEAQQDKTDQELLLKKRELAVAAQEKAVNAMLKAAELKLKEADIEATHDENLVDLNIKKEDLQINKQQTNGGSGDARPNN
jgi:hypothetical protein